MSRWNVVVRNVPQMRLAAMEHQGDYAGIAEAFERLGRLFSEDNLWPHARGMAAVYYDDPASVSPAELRSAAGVVVAESFALPADVREVIVGGGPCAVLRHKGSYEELPSAWQAMQAWLGSSAETPSGAPSFEMYLNSPEEVAPAELLTDVCMPLLAEEGGEEMSAEDLAG